MSKKLAIAMFGQKRLSREGGVEIVVKELCTRMAQNGCDVTCYNRAGHHVSGAEYDDDGKTEYEGIRQKSVPTIERRGLAAVSSSAFAALYSAFGKYDVVHIHAEGPAFFAWLPKMFGKRVVVTVHGIDWQREKWQSGLGSKFIHQGEKNAAKYADEVIVLSKGVQDYFNETYGRETHFMDRLMTTAVEPQDYVAEDGLLYCGSCNTPKEAFFPNGRKLFGRDRHPAECLCRQEAREKQEEEERTRLHHEKVRRLKLQGFTDWAMQNWTFENDHGQNPQMQLARRYVNHWPEMREKNVGLLLWGGVGTGKSYTAGCIANALMEQEVAVCMTNFARIMNELNSTFAGRNEVVDKLCSYPLLVIDDFGMERGTEYALEQIYNIIDSRYRSRKPLIVTTNLTLTELKNPQDTAHARIYDRLLELCTPIACTGPSMRKNIGQAKLNLLKTLLA